MGGRKVDVFSTWVQHGCTILFWIPPNFSDLGDHPFAHLTNSLKEISAITNHHLM
jgi:hypothetical protein